MLVTDLDDFHADNDYGYADFHERNFIRNDESHDSPVADFWPIVCRFFATIVVRIGFILVQVGNVPVTNTNLILLQNIADFSWITIVYGFCGFSIAYNRNDNGIIGWGEWIGGKIDRKEAIVGWQSIVISSAICTSCLAGRTHTVAYLLIGTIMCGFLQPLAIHWAWTANGWMNKNTIAGYNLNFRDYGGSTIVHTTGSVAGCIGCAILGRRIIRLRDIDDASIPADSAGTSFAGYFLIFMGLQSLCFPSAPKDNSRSNQNEIPLILVNNLLGSSSCCLVVVALHFLLSREPFNHWTVMRCVQASIAGLIIVSAGVNVYNPLLCLALGFSGGIIHYLVSRSVFQSAFEDYCNILATHLLCSLVGSCAMPLALASPEILKNPLSLMANFAWQVICLVAIVALIAVPITMAFGLLECLGLLRNRSEIVNHMRAIVAAERGPSRGKMERLFRPDGESLYLQPSTAQARRRQVDNENPPVNDSQSTARETQVTEAMLRPAEKMENSVNFAFISNPRIDLPFTRMKKSRQVYTLRSKSEIAIGDRFFDSIGDNAKSAQSTKRDEEKTTKDDNLSPMECSGDGFTENCSIIEDCLIPQFDHLSTKISAKKLKKLSRDPYKLRRTQKCTNFRVDSIAQKTVNVQFLVSPEDRSFPSTESENELENLEESSREKCCEYLKNFAFFEGKKSEIEDVPP